MIKLYSFLILAVLTLFQCGTAETGDPVMCPDAESYIIKDMTGLAGCTWVLVKGDQNYEPMNLADFYNAPMHDQEVMMEIEERPDFASSCQVGIIVEIVCSN